MLCFLGRSKPVKHSLLLLVRLLKFLTDSPATSSWPGCLSPGTPIYCSISCKSNAMPRKIKARNPQSMLQRKFLCKDVKIIKKIYLTFHQVGYPIKFIVQSKPSLFFLQQMTFPLHQLKSNSKTQ